MHFNLTSVWKNKLKTKLSSFVLSFFFFFFFFADPKNDPICDSDPWNYPNSFLIRYTPNICSCFGVLNSKGEGLSKLCEVVHHDKNIFIPPVRFHQMQKSVATSLNT